MYFIPLEELKGKNRANVLAFLQKNELLCTQLSANIKKNIMNCFAVYINDISANELYGILSIKKTILHCLPFANSEEQTAMQSDFISSFADFFLQNKFEFPVCINGTKSGTDLLLSSFKRLEYIPAQINQYDLMKLESSEFLKKVSSFNSKQLGLDIIRCKKELPSKLFSQLYEMQKKYELEEVVPDCLKFDEDSCRLRLLNSLRTQCVLAVCKNGDVVAKAGTNSIGFKTVQIGGVYTIREERGRHLGSFVMTVLLVKLIKLKRVPVLFVKKQNTAASKLYETLSFLKISDYTIAYFKSKLSS